MRYTCAKELGRKKLRANDEVEFRVPGRKTAILYYVRRNDERYYMYTNGGYNDLVFRKLKLEKVSFTKKAYKYYPTGTLGWPKTKRRDSAALTRCVIALFKEIDAMERRERRSHIPPGINILEAI